jgi:predicted ATPase
MRIKHIYISEYKNLKDFSIDFEGESFIDVFVGKNGTGKSNFFEAVLEMFQHLLEDEFIIQFSYKFIWELNDQEYYINWNGAKWLDINESETRKPTTNILPENILVYYSGHNGIISTVLDKYEELHEKLLNSRRKAVKFHPDRIRKFIGIGSNYKSILIAVMLLQHDNIKAKEFILNKLGIKNVGNEIKITFKRPNYARGNESLVFNEFKSLEKEDEKRFWGAEGFFEEFLEQIWSSEKIPSERPREEGYLNSGDNQTDSFIMYRSFESMQEKLSQADAMVIFSSFDNLKSIGMLDNISLEVELESGQKINIDQFSDGQFQSVYIYAVTELFKDKNCITLLDEPDSFLHPEWQFDFLKQVLEITAKSSESNHVLMSSHSAITLISHERERIRFFDFKGENKAINNYTLPKRVAIEKLSNKLIRFTEQEQILSIVNTIQIEKKPVLFTEGKTDPIIIKEAWNKLYPEEPLPFIPFYAFGHRFVIQVMKDPEVIKDMRGLPIFGLFDFDKGFNTWNGFSANDLVEDIHQGLVKQIDGIKEQDPEQVFAIMLPVPADLEITKQVLNEDTGKHWGDKSLMAIEHLFMHHPDLGTFFKIDDSRPDNFKKFIGEKVQFAKTTIPQISREYFEVFIPLFEFIKSKIPSPVAID